MAISLRAIHNRDLGSIVQLMCEFAVYEDLSEYCTITEERLRAVMFGDDSFVEGLIALDDDKAVAYAIFYPSFSSFRGERSLYLEDIYISNEYRRHDLGTRMLKEIARTAKSQACERIDFLVLDWNEPAVRFYLKHGAERNDDERHFKFSGAAFERLAS